MEQRQPLPLIQPKNRAISGVCGANCGTRTFIVLHCPAVNLLKRRTKCSAVTFGVEFLGGILVEHYGKVKLGKGAAFSVLRRAGIRYDCVTV